MVRIPLLALGVLAGALASPLLAQEPHPVRLQVASFDADGRVDLDYAWRFAPGDGPGREATGYDDSGRTPARPALEETDLPSSGWSGNGWFRRHLLIDRSLQGRMLALRLTAPGTAEVYVDGRRVLAVGEGGAPPEYPGTRNDGALVRLSGLPHVLAVRYVYPSLAPRPRHGIGFLVSLSIHPGAPPAAEWPTALRGAVVALPLFLALLHLALFSFDTRARENLFYALEMLTFAGIVLESYREVLLPGGAARQVGDRLVATLPILAILFGALTYYALRTRPWPPSWRLTVAIAGVLLPLSLVRSNGIDNLWVGYFLVVSADVIRIERSGRTVKREGLLLFLGGLATLGLAILLQVLVNFRLLESVAGVREVYVFGILASAVGMSLYLARTLGQSRLHEAENARKTLELARARELQLSLLPGEMPRVAGLDVAAATQTATEVGGDYYDVRPAGDGVLLFAFGDATGHGLAAGIVVTAAKALFSSLAASGAPRELLASCDRAMAAMQLPTLRMCLALARVSAREVTIASAAMPPLLLCRAATGEIEELGAGGLPLGRRLAAGYEERTTSLGAGDTLLFASDGFAELADADSRQLGYDGASAAFRRAAQAATAGEVIERLLAEAAAFRGMQPQEDDVTFLAVRVRDGLR